MGKKASAIDLQNQSKLDRTCALKSSIISVIFPNGLNKIMDWRQHLNIGSKKVPAKPAVSETRLSVEFLLGLFAAGWTEQQVLEKYPALTSEKLRAALAAADSRLVSSIANRELLEIIEKAREEFRTGKTLSLEEMKRAVLE